jgi:putative transposase
MPRQTPSSEPLRSATGVVLDRPTAFRFTLDLHPGGELAPALWRYAGARRFAFNQQLTRVRAALDENQARRQSGEPLVKVPWSELDQISSFTAWKLGRAPDSPVNDDGTRELIWRGEVCQDAFQGGVVDLGRALANWADSRSGRRTGRKVGFPKHKARKRTTPSFRLYNRKGPSPLPRIRVEGPRALRLPGLGVVRVRESTRPVRRMLTKGRFHPHFATVSYRQGRWQVTITGVAGSFHPARRDPAGRHPRPVGVDLGIRRLATVADTHGTRIQPEDRALRAAMKGVKALKGAQPRLRRAGQAWARTKPESAGRANARRRLTRTHARVVWRRRDALAKLTTWLATKHTTIVVEDLNVAGMFADRRIARHLGDAAFGELRWLVSYKAAWYGAELVIADRWFASSKTCSACGRINDRLRRGDRVFLCPACGLAVDRDVNAAVNLARWVPRSQRR